MRFFTTLRSVQHDKPDAFSQRIKPPEPLQQGTAFCNKIAALMPNSQIATELNPIHQLLREHVAFRATCDELRGVLELWAADGYRASVSTKDYASLLRCRETIREHLNVHLIKEEEIFFPRLERLVPQGRVKFLFLNYDHEFLREYFDDFSAAISNFESDRVPMHRTIERLIKTGHRIVDNLLQHILAEDTVYFELAESGFSPEELEEMGHEMQALENRLREA